VQRDKSLKAGLALIILIALSFCEVNLYFATGRVSAQFSTTDDQLKMLYSPSRHDGTNKGIYQSNPDLLFLDNASAMLSYSLASYWTDSQDSCGTVFKCTANYTSGWGDNRSLQILTTNNSNDMWSGISGNDISVYPTEQFQFVTHMKLNQFATASHVVMEGYNDTAGKWYQIAQCPSATNGPLDWTAFKCNIKIPKMITEIRPILNAGWSSQRNQEAITLFDALIINRTFTTNLEGYYQGSLVVSDPALKVQVVAHGLHHPTSMAFLGQNDILVEEQNEGTIKRIVNGTILPKPLLQVNVGNELEWGLLGLAVQSNKSSSGNNLTYVFVYYTETESRGPDHGKVLGNRLYRYQLSENGTKLYNPKLLLNLPANEGVSFHNGGAITIGPDKNLYVPIGDVDNHQTEAQNYRNSPPDGTGGILRITQDGKPVGNGILGKTYPLNLYYAYGIRNSFGIDFDPISGKLWDTENGPEFGDEINLVEPGFNSGWAVVQGTTKMASTGSVEYNDYNYTFPDSLVDFKGKGKYRSPELTWGNTTGPTALKFFNSRALGEEYANDMFVGSTTGYVYHFDLNKNRDALLLRGLIADKVANNLVETRSLVWAQGSSVITDIEVGPDGLYLVSESEGIIYKIVRA